MRHGLSDACTPYAVLPSHRYAILQRLPVGGLTVGRQIRDQIAYYTPHMESLHHIFFHFPNSTQRLNGVQYGYDYMTLFYLEI